MKQSPRCHIIIDSQPNCGSWNMAVDEVLLEAAADCHQCSLRWYQWSEATISLGYFQKLEHTGDHSELTALPMVRRLTGGGAILHHHELTYSCTIPTNHPWGRLHHETYYERIHERIIAVMAEYGISARMRGESSGNHQQTFLCFGRGDARDVVLQGQKILGSAQRRRRGAVIQHGSLLLKHSPHASQFPGILDLTSRSFDIERLKSDLASELGSLLDATSAGLQATLADEQKRQAEQLERQKYSDPDWNGIR